MSFIVGMFLGTLLGLVLTSLCVASSNNWEEEEDK